MLKQSDSEGLSQSVFRVGPKARAGQSKETVRLAPVGCQF
jgi:hypothetical protein